MSTPISEIVFKSEDLAWIKDIVLPSVNVLVTLFAGVVVIYYLHRKTARSGLKEKLYDIYFDINDNYLKIFSGTMNEILKHQLYIYFPTRSSERVREAYEEAVEFFLSKFASDKLLVLIEIHKSIHLLEFILGDSAFNKNFKSFYTRVFDIAFFPDKVNIYNEVESNVELDRHKINELTNALIDKLITKNECRDRLIEIMYPISDEVRRIITEKSKTTVSPQICLLKKIIKEY